MPPCLTDSRIEKADLLVPPGSLLGVLDDIVLMQMADEERRAAVVLRLVAANGFPVVIGIAIQAAVSAGIVGAYISI